MTIYTFFSFSPPPPPSLIDCRPPSQFRLCSVVSWQPLEAADRYWDRGGHSYLLVIDEEHVIILK